LDVYVASKVVQTVSSVAVVVHQLGLENVFVLLIHKDMPQITMATVSNLHPTNLRLINAILPEEEVYSLCPKDLNTNVSAMKNKA
jgi:hypothetical protein